MNGLSWLLYLADLVEGLKVVGIVMAIGGGIGTAIGAIGLTASSVDREYRQEADLLKAWTGARNAFIKVLVIGIVLAVVSPSRNTVVLIAASQVGESVLAMEDVQKLGGEAGALATDSIKLLRKYVTDQLDPAPEKKD